MSFERVSIVVILMSLFSRILSWYFLIFFFFILNREEGKQYFKEIYVTVFNR